MSRPSLFLAVDKYKLSFMELKNADVSLATRPQCPDLNAVIEDLRRFNGYQFNGLIKAYPHGHISGQMRREIINEIVFSVRVQIRADRIGQEVLLERLLDIIEVDLFVSVPSVEPHPALPGVPDFGQYPTVAI
jgi:hypothetical protein